MGGESRGPYQGDAAAGLVLSTLYLAMEWILQAAPPNRSVCFICTSLQTACLRRDKPHEELCHCQAINGIGPDARSMHAQDCSGEARLALHVPTSL